MFLMYCNPLSRIGGIVVRGYVPQLFEIIRFFEILMFHWTVFGLLLLVKIKVSDFIKKSLNFALPQLYRCHIASVYDCYKTIN